ncbi:BQ2448_7884 [Microbotryum intermedium]|uniref:BQ2448_7884 protein n=1 Tax=Microbotryum intermedium TaxID=269621 RepID=A0A238FNU7_9BASI|nr:BQ2448_7884 [Microbotryum intermedium]
MNNMASSPTRPEVAILCHSPALNALKRPQLVALAKEFGLKASGKVGTALAKRTEQHMKIRCLTSWPSTRAQNVDLIKRLKQHGQELVRQPRVSATPNPQDDREGGEEMSWMVLDDQKDTSEPGDSVSNQEMDVEVGMQEFGVDADSGDKSTIPTSSSSSSLASTIRSVGGSLLRKLKSTTNLPNSSSQSSIATIATPSGPVEADSSSLVSPIRPSTPRIYPSLTPQSIASYSPFALGVQDHSMMEVTPEIHNNQQDSSFSTLSTMTSSSCASSLQTGTGIRLVSRPTDYGASSSTTTLPLPATSMPAAEHAEPSFISDRERDFTSVAIPQGTTHVITLAPVSPELCKPSTSDARFIFGSPLPKAESAFTFSLSPGPSIERLLAPPEKITNSETSLSIGGNEGLVSSRSTTELVMEEMNRRALESLAQSSTLNQSISSLSHSHTSYRPQAGPNVKGNKRMFDVSHRKVFDRMQGIDMHYAAKRPREATTNTTFSTSTSTSMFRSTSSKSLFHKGDEDEASRSSKKLKLTASTLGNSLGSKRLFRAGSSTLSSNPMKEGKQSPEKVASALREQGWLGTTSSRTGTSGGMSTLTTSLRNPSRNGEKEQSSEDREEVKRRLAMLKHQRRKSQAQQVAAGMRKKRVSLGRELELIVATPKPSGSLTKSLFRATFGSKKSTTNGVPPVPSSVARPAPVPVVPVVLARPTTTNDLQASMSSISRPKPTHLASSIGTTRPKFDLQASLKRKPLGYTPKLGPLSNSEHPTYKLESPASTRPSSSSLFAPTLASSSKQLPSTRVLGSSLKANIASLQTNSPTVVRKPGLLQGKLGGRVQPSLAGRGGALGSTSARASAATVAASKVEE